MAKSENKTQATAVPVDEFIAKVADPQRRADAQTLVTLMSKITGQPAVLWGPTIIGFGQYHYKYESGREGDMCAAGFSPRKDSLVVYLMGDEGAIQPQLEKLGPHKMGKACLYIKRLSDVDMKVLEKLIRDAYKYAMTKLHKPA